LRINYARINVKYVYIYITCNENRIENTCTDDNLY